MPRLKKTVEALKHDKATRKNIPIAKYQSVMQKNEWDWSDLVVHATPSKAITPSAGSRAPAPNFAPNSTRA